MLNTAGSARPHEAAQTTFATGVLLVHGITGMPAEMQPLAKHLQRMGCRVSMPLLPGHGADHRQLLATRRYDWLNGVRRAFNELIAECRTIVVVGLCGGGLLNVLLAAEDSRVAGLVVLSPDFGFRAPGPATPWTRVLFPLACRIPLLKRYGYWTEQPPYGLKDPRLQRLVRRSVAASKRGHTAEYGTFRTYVGTLHEMQCLHEDVRRRAGDVTCPALIMHSLEDSLFTPRNATTLYDLLGSRDKTAELITGCDHVMTVDLRKDYVVQRIGTFVQRLTEDRPIRAAADPIEPSTTRADPRTSTNGHSTASSAACGLACDIQPRLDAVAKAEWDRLFPDLPDTLEMIQLTQDCGIPGFRFHSIVIRDHGRPILLLPVFLTDYELCSLVDVGMKPVVKALTACLPFLRSLRLLGVGFVEAEWGQVGVDRDADRATLAAAWDLALQALEALGQGLGADLTAFVNFTTESGRMLPLEKLHPYGRIAGLPFARTPITYANPEQYIADLSANMRSSLRRKLRKASDVCLVRTREPGPWIDTIYRFYVDTCTRSDVSFSRHSREFFRSVCRHIPDAEYALYFVGDQLAAFRLQVVGSDCLLDKYFGMDPSLGREYSLYFVSWFKDVEHCIAKRIPLYHSGLTEEETKVKLGAQLVPSAILFRHRRPLIHRVLTLLARRLAYAPAVPLPTVRLGTDWEMTDMRVEVATSALASAQRGGDRSSSVIVDEPSGP